MGLCLARPLNAELRGGVTARRALLALMLSAVTLPTAALLTPDTSRVYRQAIELQKHFDAFSAEEKRLQSEFRRIAENSRARKINAAAALVEVRTHLLPAWDAAVAHLAALELDRTAPARKDYELLLRYATLERDSMKALADFLESADPSYAPKVSELRAAAAAALKEFQARQKK